MRVVNRLARVVEGCGRSVEPDRRVGGCSSEGELRRGIVMGGWAVLGASPRGGKKKHFTVVGCPKRPMVKAGQLANAQGHLSHNEVGHRYCACHKAGPALIKGLRRPIGRKHDIAPRHCPGSLKHGIAVAECQAVARDVEDRHRGMVLPHGF